MIFALYMIRFLWSSWLNLLAIFWKKLNLTTAQYILSTTLDSSTSACLSSLAILQNLKSRSLCCSSSDSFHIFFENIDLHRKESPLCPEDHDFLVHTRINSLQYYLLWVRFHIRILNSLLFQWLNQPLFLLGSKSVPKVL